MKDKIENIIGYAIIVFLYFLSGIFGFERIKKLGYCLIRYSEDKPCNQCKKTNVWRNDERDST